MFKKSSRAWQTRFWRIKESQFQIDKIMSLYLKAQRVIKPNVVNENTILYTKLYTI